MEIEIVLVFALLLGIPLGILFKKCLVWLDQIDYACEKIYGVRINNFMSWAIWLLLLFFGIQFFPPLNLMYGLMLLLEPRPISGVFFGIISPIIGSVLSFLYVRNLINKTSPSVAWRVLLLYTALTFLAISFIGLILGFILTLLDRSSKLSTYRKMLMTERISGDIDR